MSFDVNMMSDEQLDELLEKPKKIPTWRVVNTQTARERNVFDSLNYIISN